MSAHYPKAEPASWPGKITLAEYAGVCRFFSPATGRRIMSTGLELPLPRSVIVSSVASRRYGGCHYRKPRWTANWSSCLNPNMNSSFLDRIKRQEGTTIGDLNAAGMLSSGGLGFEFERQSRKISLLAVTGLLSHKLDHSGLCGRGAGGSARCRGKDCHWCGHGRRSQSWGPGRNSGRCPRICRTEERNSDSLVVRTSLASPPDAVRAATVSV